MINETNIRSNNTNSYKNEYFNEYNKDNTNLDVKIDEENK